ELEEDERRSEEQGDAYLDTNLQAGKGPTLFLALVAGKCALVKTSHLVNQKRIRIGESKPQQSSGEATETSSDHREPANEITGAIAGVSGAITKVEGITVGIITKKNNPEGSETHTLDRQNQKK
ncbi:hypothetical protein Tco_1511252, partial [Tanacetum coccineum]